MPVLLTIAVPTYNRADHLERLLARLGAEVAELQGVVDVIVSNNASTDRTADVVAAFEASCHGVLVFHNQNNLGAEANISQCFSHADSAYLWIIGDDDLPRPGTIHRLVELLRRDSPSIVYLESNWVTSIADAVVVPIDAPLRCETLERADFARRVNVWLTFISGSVVSLQGLTLERRDTLASCQMGTSLVHLGWILDALDRGSVFVYVLDRCLLATAGNTGGYAVLRTFGANFKQIVLESLGRRPALARAIVRRHLVCYLPGLVWGVRYATLGRFTDEQGWSTLCKALGRHPAFWLLIAPVMRAPRPIAWCFLQLGRVAGRLIRAVDRLVAKLPPLRQGSP